MSTHEEVHAQGGEVAVQICVTLCPAFGYHRLLTKGLCSLPGFEWKTFCVFTAGVINAGLWKPAAPEAAGQRP